MWASACAPVFPNDHVKFNCMKVRAHVNLKNAILGKPESSRENRKGIMVVLVSLQQRER